MDKDKFMELFGGLEDCTVDGKCSGCGGCCSSLLPVSQDEIEDILAYAKKHNIEPKVPAMYWNAVYMRCPYLDPGTQRCRVYEARPAICRAFDCHDIEAAVKSYWAVPGAPAPVVNMWTLHGLTGIRKFGNDIPYDPSEGVDCQAPGREPFRVHVGDAVSVTLKNGLSYGTAMCCELDDEGMVIVDGDIGARFVPYADIEEVRI